MTNEEILEKQVEALEKLLQLRSAVIEELEAKVINLQNEIAAKNHSLQWPGQINAPYIGAPGVPFMPNHLGGGSIIISNSSTCPDGTPHQYPSMWGGTSMPPCSKCGAYQNGIGGGCITTTLTTAQNTNITYTGGSCINTPQLNINSQPPIYTTGYLQTVDPHDDDLTLYTLTSIAK